MPASNLDRIPDPLTDKFSLDELPRIAPWVYDEITAIGVDEVEHTIADMGENPNAPQRMQTWVAALSHHHSDFWGALAQG
jgi:hypothetical protein